MSTTLGWGDARSVLHALRKSCKIVREEPARGEPPAGKKCEQCGTAPAARYVWLTTRC